MITRGMYSRKRHLVAAGGCSAAVSVCWRNDLWFGAMCIYFVVFHNSLRFFFFLGRNGAGQCETSEIGGGEHLSAVTLFPALP